MLLIQIILILFFLMALRRVWQRYRAQAIAPRDALVWFIFWLCAGAVVVWPNATSIIARLVGIGRGADLVVYVALALIFFILFRLMVKLEELHKQLTRVIRSEALNNEKSKL